MSLGDWGEGKNKNARGMMGRGKKGRGAPALSLFPSYHAHSLFLIFLLLVEYATGAPAGWGGVGGGGVQEVKRHFFFSKK